MNYCRRSAMGIMVVSSLLLILPIRVAAQQSAAVTALPGANVESLLRYAQEHNPEFAGMRLEAEAAAQRAEVAGALADPVVRIELENITNFGSDSRPSLLPGLVGSTKYTLMQPLPFWGKRDLRRDIAGAESDQAAGRATLIWNELAAKIKTTFAQYYFVAQNEQLTGELLDLVRRLEQIAQARYASGLSAQQESIRAQVEQTGMQGELIALENERHHLRVRLNALLARNAMADLAPPLSLRPLPAAATLDYAALEERARRRNPQLIAEEARIRSADKSRELAYRNRYPDFLLGVVPTQVGGRVNTWGLMLEMNVPLRLDSRRAQEREAEAMLAAAQARREAASNQVLADLAENIAAFDAARRTEDLLATRLLPQAELSYQSALAAYEIGKLDFSTLLEAQRQIRKAKQDRLKLQAEAQMRLAEVEKLVGEGL